MPRPTRPQLIYGSATVVLATLAMLLLSEARSGVAVLAIVVISLALGVLVSVTVANRPRARAGAMAGQRSRVPSTTAVPRSHVRATTTVAEPRKHSLQR